MPRKLNQEDVINRFNKTHNYIYDYSITDYKNKRTKIKYICPIHGIVEQSPVSHMNGAICPKCFNKGKNTKDNFIKKSNIIHKIFYNYDKTIYVDAFTKVIITCPIHGDFEQIPNSHLSGYGCIKCSDRYNKKYEYTINANKVHNNLYDYSLMDYINNKTEIKIICKEHGIFLQRPDNHLQGDVCPICRETKGERKIRTILEQKNIKYEYQKKFNGCIDIRKLPFDFYIKDLNLIIEFDGKQHYESISHWGGNKTFIDQQKKDKIKNEYCKNNNIHLLRIMYYDYNNIEEILSKYLLEVTPTVTPSVMTN